MLAKCGDCAPCHSGKFTSSLQEIQLASARAASMRDGKIRGGSASSEATTGLHTHAGRQYLNRNLHELPEDSSRPRSHWNGSRMSTEPFECWSLGYKTKLLTNNAQASLATSTHVLTRIKKGAAVWEPPAHTCHDVLKGIIIIFFLFSLTPTA